MKTLHQRLSDYSESDYYGFHMPGHKRNKEMLKINLPYEIDITEIEGFDDLHHAAGILKQAQKKAASVYGAEETHFLVNGSTVGILSAILGNTNKGDTVLVARNCHKSVYHAIFMNELNPVYLYPEFCEELQLNTEVSVSAVKTALKEHLDIRAVVIVSPTYDGSISDIESIAEVVHERGIPLIVDEAHGAHFGFHSYFSDNANRLGADAVIHSLHKTLPALTQTAVLHMNGELVNRKKVRKYLDMLQSSSPSYILMASIDVCIQMLEERREELFNPYVRRLEWTREQLLSLRRLSLIETKTGHFDKSKIVLSVKDTDITSKVLYRELLERYHLQMEMAAGTYVLAMTSVGDTDRGMQRLVRALQEIDAKIDKRMSQESDTHKSDNPSASRLPRTETIYNSAVMARKLEEAVVNGEKAITVELLPWEKSEGYISTEYAYLYPPGSPLIVPGERISREVIGALLRYDALRFAIEGLQQERYIEVWING